MRSFILFSLLIVVCVGGSACANPILFAPSGTTLGLGQVRAEAAFSPKDEEGKFFWLAVGGPGFEVNLLRTDRAVGEPENLIGAQWSFLPETSITPAISIGVTDLSSDSAEGISGYAAITKHLPAYRFVSFIDDFSATFGIGLGGIRGPFAGIEAKLPLKLFFQGEYDSHDVNAAIGWQPTSMFRVKAYSLRHEIYYGAELVPIAF